MTRWMAGSPSAPAAAAAATSASAVPAVPRDGGAISRNNSLAIGCRSAALFAPGGSRVRSDAAMDLADRPKILSASAVPYRCRISTIHLPASCRSCLEGRRRPWALSAWRRSTSSWRTGSRICSRSIRDPAPLSTCSTTRAAHCSPLILPLVSARTCRSQVRSDRPARAMAILHADRGPLTFGDIPWPNWSADRGAQGAFVPQGAPLATAFADAPTADEAQRLAAVRLAELEDLIYEHAKSSFHWSSHPMQSAKQPSVSARAAKLVDAIVADADALRISVTKGEHGERLIDLGGKSSGVLKPAAGSVKSAWAGSARLRLPKHRVCRTGLLGLSSARPIRSSPALAASMRVGPFRTRQRASSPSARARRGRYRASKTSIKSWATSIIFRRLRW